MRSHRRSLRSRRAATSERLRGSRGTERAADLIEATVGETPSNF